MNTCVFLGRMHVGSKRENCPAFRKGVKSVTSKTIESASKLSQRGSRVHYLEDEFSDEVFGV